jgi:phosphoadenosine phosphosulfate reductase
MQQPQEQRAESSSKAADDARIQAVVENLEQINKQLEAGDPFQILEWAIDNLPGLYQTTAFGVTGCVSLDQISRISEARAKASGQVSRTRKENSAAHGFVTRQQPAHASPP